MKFKIFRLFEGINDFPLGEFCFGGFTIKTIKFITNTSEYEIKLLKYGDRASSQDNWAITHKDSLPTGAFIPCRDGKTHLQISSSCEGTLEFEYKNIENCGENTIAAQYNKIKENTKNKFYSQFYSIITNENEQLNLQFDTPYLFIDERKFKDYTYHSYDMEIFTLCEKNREHIERNVNVDNSVISRNYEILLGFDIDSNVDNVCQIFSDGEFLFSFDIMRGTHYYDCFLILVSLVYSQLTMKFAHDVNMVKYKGKMIDSKLLSSLKKYMIIVKHCNGMVLKYTNGLGPYAM